MNFLRFSRSLCLASSSLTVTPFQIHKYPCIELSKNHLYTAKIRITRLTKFTKFTKKNYNLQFTKVWMGSRKGQYCINYAKSIFCKKKALQKQNQIVLYNFVIYEDFYNFEEINYNELQSIKIHIYFISFFKNIFIFVITCNESKVIKMLCQSRSSQHYEDGSSDFLRFYVFYKSSDFNISVDFIN